jgi:hypothetical protein
LLGVEMEISHAMIEKFREEERDTYAMNKEQVSLRNQ